MKNDRFKEVSRFSSSLNKKLITVHSSLEHSSAGMHSPSLRSMFGNPTINHLSKHYEKIKIRHILAHETSLELFINHLYSEFCIECMLSLIEMTQFQRFAAQQTRYYDDRDAAERPLLCDKLQFHECIPRSKVVFGSEGNLAEKAFALYLKYIAPSTAAFEINISSSVRMSVTRVMQRECHTQLITV